MVENIENKSSTTTNVVNNKVSLPRVWHYRLLGNIFILGIIFFLASITITLKNNLVSKKFTDLSQQFYAYTSTIGFTVDDIIIEGRKKTSKEDILSTLNINRGDNILALDVYDIKQKIEKLPWIRNATVKRSFFPNIIQIKITERQVQSIWQLSNKFYPIDTEGNVIDADFKPTRPILLIVGEQAPENITELLESISEDQEIFKRIKVANFISKRRWNLILDDIENGINIKLPEENIDKAWKKLLKLNTTKGILKRKLTIIDLRLEGKVIVKLSKMSAEEKKQLQNSAKESKL